MNDHNDEIPGDIVILMFIFILLKHSYNIARYRCSLFGLGWSVVGQPSFNRDTSPRFIPVPFYKRLLS